MSVQKRKTNKRRKRSQQKVIIISSICLLLCFCAGYAAFQTKISITAKGNIIDNSFTVEELKEKVVTSGDGLYLDPVEEDRYVYKGSDPDNYVTFNDEEGQWRIIAIESDNTIKIRRINSIGSIQYDDESRYNTSSAYYCYDEAYGRTGCNVWGSSTTMLDASGNNITSMKKWGVTDTSTYLLPDAEANMNIYLNTTYYDSLSESAKNLIESHYFGVGLLENSSTQVLATDIEQEKAYLWKGNVALMNITDYVRASTDSSCTSVYAGTLSSYPCANNNYLYDESINTLTLSIRGATNVVMETSDHLYIITTTGQISSSSVFGYADYYYETNPVVYIKSDITITGSGTVGDPYVFE